MAAVLHMPQGLTQDILLSVSNCIQRGGVIAVATESFYALAAGVRHPRALERIVEIKGDRKSKPILVLVSSIPQVRQLTSHVSSTARSLMDHFWPGPLTLVLPAVPSLPHILTAGTGTIGVRQPGQDQLLELLEATGPLTGTSANRSGRSPAEAPEQIIQEFGDEIDLILDSGRSPGGSPSTLLSVVDGIHLIREGPVSTTLIQEVIESSGEELRGLSP